MIRPCSFWTRGDERLDQPSECGKVVQPGPGWGLESLRRALDLGFRPLEKVDHELPHDWIVLDAGNWRTRVVGVRHAHLIAQVGKHCGCRQAAPVRWLRRIEAR